MSDGLLQGHWPSGTDWYVIKQKNTSNQVTMLLVLGNDPKSKMVTSRSGGTLHFVRVVSPGQYVCDKNCLQWCSSQICSHTFVTAKANGNLELFCSGM